MIKGYQSNRKERKGGAKYARIVVSPIQTTHYQLFKIQPICPTLPF